MLISTSIAAFFSGLMTDVEPLSAFECTTLKEAMPPYHSTVTIGGIEATQNTHIFCDDNRVTVSLKVEDTSNINQAKFNLLKLAKKQTAPLCESSIQPITIKYLLRTEHLRKYYSNIVPTKEGTEGARLAYSAQFSTDNCEEIELLIEEEQKSLTDVELEQCVAFNESQTDFHERGNIIEQTIKAECGTNRSATIRNIRENRFSLMDTGIVEKSPHVSETFGVFHNKDIVSRYCNDLKSREKTYQALVDLRVTRYGIETNSNNVNIRSGYVDLNTCK
ncbi:hypothetical protein F7U66_01970 [Vibrio parahaemolyticus]|nr:hypothetical protein [Vibrio parahaemolyticus]